MEDSVTVQHFFDAEIAEILYRVESVDIHVVQMQAAGIFGYQRECRTGKFSVMPSPRAIPFVMVVLPAAKVP